MTRLTKQDAKLERRIYYTCTWYSKLVGCTSGAPKPCRMLSAGHGGAPAGRGGNSRVCRRAPVLLRQARRRGVISVIVARMLCATEVALLLLLLLLLHAAIAGWSFTTARCSA